MKKTLNLVLLLFLFSIAAGQNTVGLTHYVPGNTAGYVLFSPMTSNNSYLIDKCGEKVHEWNTSAYKPALSAYLLEDGSLLRTAQLNNSAFNAGGSGGGIERFDWNGTLQWSYTISDTNACQHHDIAPLPNGNILCIVWDSRSRQEAILNGKDSSYTGAKLWSEKIVELQPVGTDSAIIVWEWKVWDHLVQHFDSSKLNYGVVADHPERVNINYFPGAPGSSDWIHFNSIDYNPSLDQILLSSHTLSEVWIIDHSTTTQEAASHSGGNAGKGGDLLYRWGNPQAYQRGNPAAKVFYGQHHASWIPQGYPNEGKILVFNNGLSRPGMYSSVDMIEPPLTTGHTYTVPVSGAFLPASLFWTYTANPPADFYSSNISGAYALQNGSFLITHGTDGYMFELDSTGQELWKYVNPVSGTGILSQGSTPSNNLVFRANFYAADYAGFSGHTLSQLGEIELNPSQPSICDTLQSSIGLREDAYRVAVFPNPFDAQLHIQIPANEEVIFILYDNYGRQIIKQIISQNGCLGTADLTPGVYYYQFRNSNGEIAAGRIIK